jgi:hypothetical protein
MKNVHISRGVLLTAKQLARKNARKNHGGGFFAFYSDSALRPLDRLCFAMQIHSAVPIQISPAAFYFPSALSFAADELLTVAGEFFSAIFLRLLSNIFACLPKYRTYISRARQNFLSASLLPPRVQMKRPNA